jgi:S-DNA-T family DNA segregation ATPase FtsK/SpoIIIE
MNTISDIITASYTTSKDADLVSKNIKKWLGCEYSYEIARLALGRSLMLDEAPPTAPDGKGSPLKGLQLFGDESDGNYLWIALLGEQLRLYGQPQFSLEALQQLVRNHWHRGVYLLDADWQKAGEDEAKFIDLLARRAALPETLSIQVTGNNGVEVVVPQVSAPDIECNSLLKKLKVIGVAAEIRDSVVGPRLIRYRLFLSDAGDLSLLVSSIGELEFSLGVGSIKLYSANEPQTCFLEIPRKQSEWQVVAIDLFDSAARSFCASNMLLPVSPGVDVVGVPVVFDLAEAPHLLVGGTTGSGKSVCVNSLLLSLFLASRNRPIKLALIDPKQVEFSLWRDCGLLYSDIATSTSAAISLLDELVEEMESRYAQFAELGVKNLTEARERGFDGGWIVVAVDELADLVMQGKPGKSAEEKLVQLAQKARSAGIHLILATQRPDAKTFSGLLRSNCPARIALKVQKSTESNIILDETGAESLLGKGDMLIKGVGLSMQRAHGYFIQAREIEARLSQPA